MSAPLPPAAAAELAALYARLDAEIAAHQPRCELSGRCCDFPRSGQRLFATQPEVQFARQAAHGHVPAAPSGLCPWWVDGRCSNRAGRPLGCRIYFCDPQWEPRMPDVYERFHGELKALHERHGLAYRYAPFVDALQEDRP